MRTAFDKNLNRLQEELFKMSDMVNKAIDRSITALKERDVTTARQIQEDDRYINNIRWEIEERCIHLMATQQPVARDLREIIAVLTIITELERIADYAEGIAKIVVKLGDQLPVKPYIDIPRMAEIATGMINKTMKAYTARDTDSAYRITEQDDDLDGLYHQVLRELISIMIENPKTITSCTYLIWVAHNLERIGDRVTNICERIIFLVTGEIVENTDKNQR